MAENDEETDQNDETRQPAGVGGNVENSALGKVVTQAGAVHGDISTTINYFKDSEAELLARPVNKDELDDLRGQFVAPENIQLAIRILDNSQVVVLRGTGCGRTFTGLWLLDRQGCARIVHLNRDRRMRNVKDTELRVGDGYLWDVSAQCPFLNLFGEAPAGDTDHGPADHGLVVRG